MRILAAIVFLFGLTAANAQPAQPTVDLELVLAVDISYSMDADELRLQRDGYINAITSRQVLDAIREGAHGRIAVAYVEWAGASQQSTLIDWQIVDGPASAQVFADKLAETPPNRAYRTSISGALTYSAKLLGMSPYQGERRVIDISGDGPNNQGDSVTRTRDMVLAQGIGINGLPLVLKNPNSFSLDVQSLEDYYRDCVIGGSGAFVIAVKDKARFADAIRTKLVLEISAAQPPPRFIHTQDAKANCSIGEQIWRERYGDSGPEWQ